MKILIVGASSFIGNSLFNFLKTQSKIEVFGTYNKNKKNLNFIHLDILNPIQVEKVIKDLLPECLIWVAGLKDIKKCEEDIELAKKINTYPIYNLMELYKKNNLNSHLIYISTDYVFDGQKGFYRDCDIPSPNTAYGISKFLAEEEILKSQIKKFTIVRTSAVIGKGGVFFEWLVDNIVNSNKIELYSNNYFTPTPLNFFNKNILDIIVNKRYGIFHICSDERLSRYDLGLIFARLLKNHKAVLLPIKNQTYADFSLIPSDFCKQNQVFVLKDYLKQEIL